GHRGGGENYRLVRDQPAAVADAEERNPDPGEAKIADAPHAPRRRDAAEDRADSLERRDHADERRPAMQPFTRDREDQRLAEPRYEEGETDAGRELAQDGRLPDVRDAGRDLAQEMVRLGGGGRLGEPQRDECRRRDDEAAEWSDEPREREHEEDESGGTVRPRQHLRPDAEDDDHRAVTEHRQGLADEEQPEVRP